jgi:transcriptional regulator with XRE-family HTH domain
MATPTTTPPANLRAALAAKGLTQHELSIATGIHSATVSRYANGLKPTDDHAAKIAKALR